MTKKSKLDKLMEENEKEQVKNDEVTADKTVEGALSYPSHEEMDERLTEAEQKAEVLKDQLIRLQAEMENVTRRAERDVSLAHKYGNEKIILEMLPVLDGMERGMAHEVDDNELANSLLEGMTLTHDLLLKTLDKFGLKQIDPLNDVFNPEFHEAVKMEEQHDSGSNTVLQVLQKGYILHDRLVRPALVIVAK